MSPSFAAGDFQFKLKEQGNAVYSICYVSNAVFPRSDISNLDILRTARRFNALHGITGYLVRSPTRFAQLLEGSEDDVRALYERIATDRRHFTPRVLTEERKSERIFEDWDMGFSEIGSDTDQALFEAIRNNASGDMHLPTSTRPSISKIPNAR